MLEHLCVSVVSFSEQRVSVVFGYRSEHKAPQRLVESLLSQPQNLLGTFIAQYVFAHLENVYFSASWWSSLSASAHRQFRGLAVNANPYYDFPSYLHDQLVPWKFESLERFNGRGA